MTRPAIRSVAFASAFVLFASSALLAQPKVDPKDPKAQPPKADPKPPAKAEPKTPAPKAEPKTPAPKTEPKTPAPKSEPQAQPKGPAPKAPSGTPLGGPFELTRALREGGLPDLAMEYLDEKGDSLPAEYKSVLPLERAKVRLELAELETEDAKRDGLVNQAKAEFDKFLKTAPADHPSVPEANIALARVLLIGAKTALSRATKIQDDEAYKRALAAVRPQFVDAGKRFGSAIKSLDAQIAGAPPTVKPALEREKMQAEIDQAIASFLVYRTYFKSTADENAERAKNVDAARKTFDDIAKRYAGTSAAAIAKAWAGECYRVIDSPKEMQSSWDDAKKDKSPGAAAGIRMVRYFESRVKGDAALGEKTDPAIAAARSALAGWLQDYGGGRQSTESYAIRFQLGKVKQLQGERLCKVEDDKDNPGKKKLVLPIPESAKAFLREAEKDFARVSATDNEYSDRASDERTRCIRLIVGNADTDPAKLTKFDEAVMTGLVQFDRWANAKDEKAKKAAIKRTIQYLERALDLPAPPDAAREVIDTELRLVYAYLAAGQAPVAAILGDRMAHTARATGPAAKAGLYAIQGYLSSSASLPPDDNAGRAADRARALALAAYLDKTFPNDPSTDNARIVLGQLLSKEGRHAEAFEALARVGPSSPKLANARLMQGVAAFELIRPQAKTTPEQKHNYFKRVIEDLDKVPAPQAAANSDDASVYVRLRLLISQLQLLAANPQAYKDAEKTAEEAGKLVAKYTGLAPEEVLGLGFQAEENRLRAVYAQVVPDFKAAKYKEVVDRVTPMIAEFVQSGSALKKVEAAKDLGDATLVKAAAQRLDDYRREAFLVLALQTAIRQGDVPLAKSLFETLEQFGGSLDSSVNALTQLLAIVTPQIEELKAAGKKEEADKLIGGVASVLQIVASKPELSNRVRVFLGRSLKDIGSYEEAAKALALVPKPAPEVMKKSLGELKVAVDNAASDDDRKKAEDDRLAMILYRGATIELIRAHRLGKNFPEADKVLKEAMGTDAAPGWAKNAPEFRREANMLLEDKAANSTDPKAANALWGEARAGWDKIANEFKSPMSLLAGAKQGTRAAAIVLIRMKQPLPPDTLLPPADKLTQAAIQNAKPEKWVVDLLYDDQLGPDGKPLGAAITGASNDNPIKITSAKHGLANGASISVRDVAGNTAANGTFLITVVDADNFTLNGVDGSKSGPYTAGSGVWRVPNPTARAYGQVLQQTVNRLESQVKPMYFEAFFETIRCITRANASLLKGNQAELNKRFDKLADSIKKIEELNPDLADEVKAKFYGLLVEYPALKALYQQKGGKMFLTAPNLETTASAAGAN